MSTFKDTPITIHVPLHHNELLQKALDVINQDVEIKTLWRVLNVPKPGLGWVPQPNGTWRPPSILQMEMTRSMSMRGRQIRRLPLRQAN